MFKMKKTRLAAASDLLLPVSCGRWMATRAFKHTSTHTHTHTIRNHTNTNTQTQTHKHTKTCRQKYIPSDLQGKGDLPLLFCA